MYGRGCFHLLSFFGVIALFQPVCLAFNLDTADPSIYYGDENGFFGHKVLQVIDGKDKGFLVTAPLQQNGSGTVCIYMKHTNSCFTPNATMPVRLMGLSIAQESTPSTFTICSPNVVHECYENSYLNGQCYQLNEKLEPMSNFKPAFQDCTKKTVDLVFLFDGSASMTKEEFNKNKDFILDIMDSIKNSSIKFAAVQFSSMPRKVFDFNDYQNGKATKLLKDEPFMQTLTNTYLALNYTLDKLFKNQKAGASPEATKVLVIITDGDPSDTDKKEIVKQYDTENIIRFVIGVKNIVLKNLYAIASAPKTNNTFHISNYDGLAGILENFEEKIFNIEASQTALSEELKYEMSQSGISSVFHKGNLVLGSVGSNNWRGSLYEVDGKSHGHGTHIQDPDMQDSSYMGYSVAAGEKDSVSLYFTGAPRFNHTGEVVLFRKTDNIWKVLQRVSGEQFGSYFGAELCQVDVQSDGNTDFLLVGAPLFHNPQEKREGQIYVYKLSNKLELESVLNVTVPSRGRFGTTISSLADLNGDGFRDVAVGAPLEDDNRGAVYIYLGNQHTGIRPTFSQRIPADPENARIRFFGQSVAGNFDLGEDGLADLVVGSRGAAVVLRSKPVVNVKARLHFAPAEISTVNIHCPETHDNPLPMVNLTVCFDLAEVTRRRTGTTNTGLNISYSLDVDPVRQTSRGFFMKLGQGHLQRTVELMTKHCFTHSINMPNCVYDTLAPIDIRLKYAQHESERAANILNVDSATQTATEVPFEKNCRNNDTCIAELEVDFTFTTPTLVVVNHNNFNVTVQLANIGDDSFNTKLYLFYPPGLSFSMLNLLKSTRPTLPSCKDLEGVLNETMCGVSLPVYHSGTNATFQALFRIMDTYEWDSEISMTITGKSDNNNSTMSSMTKSIPVQYQVVLTVAVHEDTFTYLNFTLEDHAPKKVVVTYEVKNLGFKEFPVTVSVTIPTKMEYGFEINNHQVVIKSEQDKRCVETNMINSSDNCTSGVTCKTMVCEPFSLASYSTTKVVLSGEASFKDFEQRAKGRSMPQRFSGVIQDVIWESSIEVTYDKHRYVQASSKQSNEASFPRAQPFIRVELIMAPDIILIVAVGCSAGFLLLFIIALVMFKMGFFKRKTMEYYKEQDEMDNERSSLMKDPAAQTAPAESVTGGPLEEKALLQSPDIQEHAAGAMLVADKTQEKDSSNLEVPFTNGTN